MRRFALRPMNCPGACLVYASERRSYRDLPLRLAEFGLVSRNEREGVLHGLLRVRAFTQDDAHVYCTPEQITDEVDSICQAIDELYARFGFDQVRVELSTRPDKSIGTDEQWQRAEGALREALERQGRDYEVSPGEGTFYGPKIDFHITDALGRSWQCGTCQLDFQMPERFDLSYQGRRQRRAPAGDDPPSAARLDGALRRHPDRAPRRAVPGLAGAASRPAILPVADRHLAYAREVAAKLRRGGRARAGRRALGVGRQEGPRRRGRPSSPTCWWSATGSRRRAPSPSAPTTRATSARCRVEALASRLQAERSTKPADAARLYWPPMKGDSPPMTGTTSRC